MEATQAIGHAVYQPGAEDAHGNPVVGHGPTVQRLVYGYGPRTNAAEPGGTQVIEGLDVFSPLFAVDPRDLFVVNGNDYMVVGEVSDWTKGPFGFSPGQVVHLKRVEGGV